MKFGSWTERLGYKEQHVTLWRVFLYEVKVKWLLGESEFGDGYIPRFSYDILGGISTHGRGGTEE